MNKVVEIDPLLPQTETTIFTVMSKLAADHNAINLGQGFPDFDCDPILLDLVKKHLGDKKNQYAPMPGVPQLRQIISKKIENSYGHSLNPDTQLCITSGATQGLLTAILATVRAGDEVIIFEPAYDSYTSQIRIAGGVPVPYIMHSPEFKIDWEEVANMINEKTRMIMINTPHNPTGTILNGEDLEALQEIVRDKNIVVLSDEVYEHLIFDSEVHQSVLRYPELFQKSMAVFSFGKTLHATGWKLGYIVGPEYLMNEFKSIHQWNVFSSNSFLQYAIAEYLTDSSVYESLPSFFESKRDLLSQLLKSSALTEIPSKGTYFQLYDYSQISDKSDIEFAKYLTEDIGVAVIPLSPFYSNRLDEKLIRFCFAKKDSTLETAADILNRRLN